MAEKKSTPKKAEAAKAEAEPEAPEAGANAPAPEPAADETEAPAPDETETEPGKDGGLEGAAAAGPAKPAAAVAEPGRKPELDDDPYQGYKVFT